MYFFIENKQNSSMHFYNLRSICKLKQTTDRLENPSFSYVMRKTGPNCPGQLPTD